MRPVQTFANRSLLLGCCMALGLMVVLCPAHVLAKKPSKQEREACAASYTKGKERASAAVLREARELFARCAKVSCGDFLRRECGQLYTRMDADIPSVIPVVTDAAGTPHALVEVKVDGTLLTSRLDGHAMQVDPGKHEFSFSTDDGVFATQKVMILQGQHNVAVKAILPFRQRRVAGGAAVATPAALEVKESPRTSASEPPVAAGPAREPAGNGKATDNATGKTADREAAVAAETSANEEAPEQAPPASVVTTTEGKRHHMTALSYVIGGVGLAGIGGYFLLTTWGRKDNSLLEPCAAAGNLCAPSDVDHVRKLYLAANISGAVGLVALATSAYLYMRSSSFSAASNDAATVASRKQRGGRPSLRVLDLKASPMGALAALGGTF